MSIRRVGALRPPNFKGSSKKNHQLVPPAKASEGGEEEDTHAKRLPIQQAPHPPADNSEGDFEEALSPSSIDDTPRPQQRGETSLMTPRTRKRCDEIDELRRERDAIMARIQAAKSTTTPVLARLLLLHEASKEQQQQQRMPSPPPASAPAAGSPIADAHSPRLTPEPTGSIQRDPRRTMDFMPHIQAMLKTAIVLGGTTPSDDGPYFDPVDNDALPSLGNSSDEDGEVVFMRRSPKEPPASPQSATSSSHTSIESAGSSASDSRIGLLPASAPEDTEPPLEKQMLGVLKTLRGCICECGWKCWLTDASCGGAMVEGTYEHRQAIAHQSADAVGQYAVCCAFLRHCKPAAKPVSSDVFLRALDIYAQSRTDTHHCRQEHDAIAPEKDLEARRYLEKDSATASKRIPRGLFVMAAIYLGCAKAEELEEHRGPDVPIYIEPPASEHALSYVSSQRQQKQLKKQSSIGSLLSRLGSRGANRAAPSSIPESSLSPRGGGGASPVRAQSPPPKLAGKTSSPRVVDQLRNRIGSAIARGAAIPSLDEGSDGGGGGARSPKKDKKRHRANASRDSSENASVPKADA